MQKSRHIYELSLDVATEERVSLSDIGISAYLNDFSLIKKEKSVPMDN